MKSNLADIYKEDPVKACRLALRRTRQLPERERLEACNRLLECYGTEAVRGRWQNGYWCDIVAAYCNTGETYAPTIIQVRGPFNGARSTFRVSTLGDFVERNQRRFRIE